VKDHQHFQRQTKAGDEPSTSNQEPVDSWLRTKSIKEIREAQLNDVELKPVIQWLKTKNRPEWNHYDLDLKLNSILAYFWFLTIG
jgi:hypothetical protein